MAPESTRKPKAKRKDSYHHGDLQNALLEAGLKLLAAGGPEALTLREVAKRAGVSHAAPYRHYPSKEHLLAAIAERGFRALAASLTEASSGVEGAGARLVAKGLGYIRFAREHGPELRIMFRDTVFQSGDPQLLEAGNQAFGLLLSEIEAGQRAGELREGDALIQAAACWSLVHGFSLLLLDNAFGPTLIDAQAANAAARTALETLVRGMQAAKASSRPR